MQRWVDMEEAGPYACTKNLPRPGALSGLPQNRAQPRTRFPDPELALAFAHG